jgi:demethylmenaquinone methyltransferase / 2-methoxy-6-polyprenyl-1,4-benzoquinol methylase
MISHNQEKNKLVNSVFNKVSRKYDFMNDVMSFGIHRLWKKNMIQWLNPQKNSYVVDVASGTGDLAKIISEQTDNQNKIFCVEPNQNMMNAGKNKLVNYKNIKWYLASAERLPFKDNTFDYYTISFGIRNVSNINMTLKEAHRVLKIGGRFMCLEFSKIENDLLNKCYKQFSKSIPFIGKYIVGSSEPYKYLIESIEKFYNQKELSDLITNNKFSNTEFRNLSNGISAIHSAWKI